MSKSQSLKAESRKRTGSGVLKEMRREGYVPSVIYGGGRENANVKVKEKSFKDLMAQSASENILVNLNIDDTSNQLAFLQDVQHNALTGRVLHIDFLAVNSDTEITANIPVELEGEAPGSQAGGLLEQLLHSVEIHCLPKDLPEIIYAGVETLEIGDALHIGEVKWPEGVRPSLGADVVLALVAKARVAEDEEAEEAAAAEAASAAAAAATEEAAAE